MMCVEEILDGVVVGRCSDDYEVSIAIGTGAVKRSFQVQFLLSQIFFDVFILNGRDAIVNFLHLFGDDIHSCHLMVLAEKSRNGKSDIARACNCNFKFAEVSHTLF